MPTRATGAGEQADRNLRALDAGAAGLANATADATNRQERSNERQEQRLHQGIEYYRQYEAEKTEKKRFDRQMGLQEKALKLEGAKAGFDYQDRKKGVADEMAKGAGQPPLQKDPNKMLGEQGDKGLEYNQGQGGWVQRPEAAAAAQSQAQQQRYEAETRRISAEASLMQANTKMTEALQAKAKGDIGAYKEMSAEAQKLNLKPVENWTGDFDKFLDGTMEPRKVEALFGEQAQSDPKLGAALQDYMANDGNVNAMQSENRERFNAAWKGKIDMENIKFTMRSGGKLSPYMDLGSPMGRQFTEAVGQVESYFNIVNALEDDALSATFGGMGKAMRGQTTRRFKSFEERNDFMRSEAAKLIITQSLSGGSNGMRGTAPGGQAQGGDNGRTPIGEGPEAQSRHGASSTDPEQSPGWTVDANKYDRRGGRIQQKHTPEGADRVQRGIRADDPKPWAKHRTGELGFR